MNTLVFIVPFRIL